MLEEQAAVHRPVEHLGEREVGLRTEMSWR